MTETNHAAIGADARPATFDAWANEYCYGLFNDGDDGARVALLAARDAWDAAIASAAQPNNDWAQSTAELIAVRGYLADSADTPRVAHLLAQIVPATQHLPTDPAGVRRLLDTHCATIKYGAPDGTPHEGDRYSITAHDILEAFAWWVDGGEPTP